MSPAAAPELLPSAEETIDDIVLDHAEGAAAAFGVESELGRLIEIGRTAAKSAKARYVEDSGLTYREFAIPLVADAVYAAARMAAY